MDDPKENQTDNRWLTIYADAGFKNGVATYGIWIRIFYGRRTFEGRLPTVGNNNEAEMGAALLGLRKGLEFWAEHYRVPPRGISFILDSNHARTRLSVERLPRLTNSGRTIPQREHELHAEFRKLLPPNAKVNFKPVKGHSGTRTTQTWLNNWCDKATQRAMHR